MLLVCIMIPDKLLAVFKRKFLIHVDGNFKPVFRKRQNCYRHQRSERIYPFKKRKHFAYSSPSNSDGGMSCEFVSDLSLKGSNGDASVSRSRMHGGLFT